MSQTSSRIFLGNRVLGYVSTHVPFVARFIKRRGETLIVTSIGKWFHTYGCDHFRLLAISGEHPGEITCMTGDNYHIYTAANNIIFAWRRGCEIKHRYEGHESPILCLLPFGPHLISIDEDNVLKVWDIKDETLYLDLPFDASVFKITTATHPPTYVNKILLGSEQGSLQMWNIRTSKLIYTFKGWKSSVIVLEPAPAVDVVAIGLANGKIILHNLKYDQTVMTFLHDWGDLTTISFRLDGMPIMVTGSSEGHMVMWDLEERKVSSQVESAHSGAIAGMMCLMSEPIMITNSEDNSLKMWIFDMSDGGARLLKIREGHAAPPTTVRHCEETGENILSAGQDSTLRIMNTVTETFNKSMGKASFCRKKSKKKKRLQEDRLVMPPIIAISSSMQRDKQWDSIAALHSDTYFTTTWSYNKIKMGAHRMKPPGADKTVTATCLTVTHCGNFVFIGYSDGNVRKFNMQSGIARGTCGGEDKPAHRRAVRGVETDIYNQKVITAGADDRLRFWHFRTMTSPFHVMKLQESVTFTRCHRESSLLALCNEDFSITLIDMETMDVVRMFEGHSGLINDLAFDPQCRWVITSSMDCTICTWDIPSSQLVDIFRVDKPCTSLSMSPTGDFLATSHIGQLGVFLWANKTLYSRIFLKPIDRTTIDIPQLGLPRTTTDRPEIEDLENLDLKDDEDQYKSPEQISQELITLSDLPTSRWLNLLYLDVVKKRNKPKVALTVPKAAPFFLPTVQGLETMFDLSKEQEKSKGSKFLIPESLLNLSQFGKLLNNEIYGECIDKLKSYGPSTLEIEVINLAPDAGGSIELLEKFLNLINQMLKSNRDFEVAQAYLALFLKTHTKLISENKELIVALDDVEKNQLEKWTRLQDLLFYDLCIVKALKIM